MFFFSLKQARYTDRELWQRHRFRAAANSSGFYRHDSSLGSSTLQSVLNYSIFGHIPTSSSVYSSSFYAFQMNPRRGSGINKHSTRRRRGRSCLRHMLFFPPPPPPPAPPEYLRLIQVFVHCPHSMLAGHKH